MSNIDKLKDTMHKYNVDRMYYFEGMDLNADLLEGRLFFVGVLNEDFLTEVYHIYTEDGYLQNDQDLDIWMAPEGSNDFKVYTETVMEVLNA